MNFGSRRNYTLKECESTVQMIAATSTNHNFINIKIENFFSDIKIWVRAYKMKNKNYKKIGDQSLKKVHSYLNFSVGSPF